MIKAVRNLDMLDERNTKIIELLMIGVTSKENHYL